MTRPVAAFVLTALLASTPAAAHHILGIPHYKYAEDYPQIPYLEVIAQAGPYDLDFTHFPGFPKPGERIRCKLYVRDRVTGEPFREPLRVELARRTFPWGTEPAGEPLTIQTGDVAEQNDYKFFLAFDEAEAYEILVHFPNGNQMEVIPFPVVVGKTDDRPLIFGAAGILVVAVASVAVVKRRRAGRKRSAGRSS